MLKIDAFSLLAKNFSGYLFLVKKLKKTDLAFSENALTLKAQFGPI